MARLNVLRYGILIKLRTYLTQSSAGIGMTLHVSRGDFKYHKTFTRNQSYTRNTEEAMRFQYVAKHLLLPIALNERAS